MRVMILVRMVQKIKVLAVIIYKESPRQTKTTERPVHELFAGAFRKTKVRYVNRACFPREKHQNSHQKNGREIFMNFSFCPLSLVWFAGAAGCNNFGS